MSSYILCNYQKMLNAIPVSIIWDFSVLSSLGTSDSTASYSYLLLLFHSCILIRFLSLKFYEYLLNTYLPSHPQ